MIAVDLPPRPASRSVMPDIPSDDAVANLSRALQHRS